MKRMLTIVGSLLSLVLSAQQARTLEGKVTDDNNQPVSGATVRIKGRDAGIATDNTGGFTLRVNTGDTLEISNVGFATRRVVVRNQRQITVSLLPNPNAMGEVVVIGYGRQRKSDLTGSLSSIRGKEIQNSNLLSVADALRGKAAGVQVVGTSGEPGSGVQIRIRGANSINASSEPLFVIDGVPVNADPQELQAGSANGITRFNNAYNPLASLNPNDIESVEVLKDASATAIYGSRGANGVILITTKEAKGNRTQINFRATTGFSQVPRKIDVLNGDEFAEYQNRFYPSNPLFTNSTGGLISYKDSNVTYRNWQDEVFRKASVNDFAVSIAKGTAATRYRLAFGYTNQEGLVRKNDLQRFTTQFNLSSELAKRLSISWNTNLAYTRINGAFYGNGQGNNSGITKRVLTTNPISFPNAADRGLTGDIYDEPGDFIDFNFARNRAMRGQSNLALNYKLGEHFVFRSTVGGYVNQAKDQTFYSKFIGPGSGGIGGYAISGDVLTSDFINENTITYALNSKQHTLNVLGGYTVQTHSIETNIAEASNFAFDALGVNALQLGNTPQKPFSNKTDWGLQSFLTRVNYGFRDKLLVTASLRADGSSKFQKPNQYSYFPSFALAYKLEQEKWMQPLTAITQLKLRAGYGQVGNQSINPYSSLSRIGTSFYTSNNTTQFVVTNIQSLGNPDLKWETTESYNVGLDLGLFNSRLSLTVDAYLKNTRDLLLDVPIANSSGFTSVFKNIGRVQNRGLEFTLSSINIKGRNFSWTSDFNITFNRNEIKDLGGASQILFDPNLGAGTLPSEAILRVGYPIGSVYGYIQDGLYQQGDFSAPGVVNPGVPVPTFQVPAPGFLKFKDLNGDGIINPLDRTVIADVNPKHFGGFRNSFAYKGLELMVFLQWSYGNDILNESKVLLGGDGFRNISRDIYTNLWSPTKATNDAAPLPNDAGRQQTSTYYVEDGSFLRLQNTVLSYNLPASLLKRAKMSSAKLFFAAENLLTFSKKRIGYDPEIALNYPLLTGLDYFSYPRPKSYRIGIDINF